MKGFKNIMKVMADEFDAGFGFFDPVVALWAADMVADAHGIDVAKRELSAFNRKREKLGLPIAVPAFGHRLF